MSRIRSLLERATRFEEGGAGATEAVVNSRSGLGVGANLANIQRDEVALSPESRLVYYTDPHSPAADRFRALRLRLQPLGNMGKLKKILITSPLPGDGKSTVAMNLVTVLSEQGRRPVLLVEADLHHSAIMKTLGLPLRAGLAECLENGRNPLELVRHLSPLDWYVLPAGKPYRNSTELLQGEILPKVIEQLSPFFDWMVIDSPPAISLSEILSLKNHTDGSLLVVRAGRTSRDAVEEAIALLGKEHVVGVILNGVAQSDLVYHKYGYGYDSYNGRPRGGSG
jgi:capsular exopolysaccharide synthesis family protein